MTKSVGNVLDLGCGNGIILLMLAKDFQNFAFTGVDILKSLVDIAILNFQILSDYLQKKIDFNFFLADYGKDIEALSLKKFDIIVSNPPYFKKNEGNISPLKERAIARFESTAGQSDLLSTVKKKLAPSGNSFIVYPFSRKTEFEQNCENLSLNIISCQSVDYKNKIFDKLTPKDKFIFQVTHATN